LFGLFFFSSDVLSATFNFLADVCDIVFMFLTFIKKIAIFINPAYLAPFSKASGTMKAF